MGLLVNVILFTLTLINTLFIYLVFRQIQMVVHDFDRKLTELHLDTELTEAFDGKDLNDLSKLANDLSERVKRKYRLSATSFTELVAQLHHLPVEKKLKKELVDFFEKIVIISYKDEDLGNEDKSDLKQEYKTIMRLMDKQE